MQESFLFINLFIIIAAGAFGSFSGIILDYSSKYLGLFLIIKLK